MDYRYIEQLMERYWRCETSVEEEAILRAFFSQEDIPASLRPYASLFRVEEQMMQEAHLGKDFDQRVLTALRQGTTEGTPTQEGSPRVKARRITWGVRLDPFWKAAAVVAIFLTIGMAVQHGWDRPAEEIATVDPQPGDSTSIEIVDELSAETGMPEDTLLPARE